MFGIGGCEEVQSSVYLHICEIIIEHCYGQKQHNDTRIPVSLPSSLAFRSLCSIQFISFVSFTTNDHQGHRDVYKIGPPQNGMVETLVSCPGHRPGQNTGENVSSQLENILQIIGKNCYAEILHCSAEFGLKASRATPRLPPPHFRMLLTITIKFA